MMVSQTTNSAAVQATIDQPGSTAAASASGRAAEMNAPKYGTNRSRPARIPHRAGIGTPISSRPKPITQPNTAFSASRLRKYRLSRRAASSIAVIVRSRSSAPNSRISRSRTSPCCSRMKIATTNTMPAVASGDSTGETTRSAISIGVAPGWWISTGIGLGAGAAADPAGAGCPSAPAACFAAPSSAALRARSICRSSRSMRPDRRPTVAPCTDCSLSCTVLA